MNKNIKFALTAAVTLATGLIANATVTFTGTALLRVPNISSGDVSYFIIDENNIGFGNIGSINPSTSTFTAGTIWDGTALTVGSDNLGSNFTIVGSKIAAGASSIALSGSYSALPLGNGVDSGDKFAIIVFETSTSTAIGLDTYRIYTDASWTVRADPSTTSFSATPSTDTFLQLGTTATPAFTKSVASTTVIPEPSTYAALAGVAVLGLAALRRRRA
jgi:hypothetical protein